MKLLFTLFIFCISFSAFNQNWWESFDGDGVTDIDGNFYPTRVIRNVVYEQEWMTRNLWTTRFSNGDSIQKIFPDFPISGIGSQIDTITTPVYANWDNDPASVIPWGSFYNTLVVNDTRNVCPTGWHVPTKEEFDNLVDIVNSSGADTRLKSNEYWIQSAGNNESGWTGLPSGKVDNPGFRYRGYRHYSWTSTRGFASASSVNDSSNYVFRMNYDSGGVGTSCYNVPEWNLIPIRCIKGSLANTTEIQIEKPTVVKILDLMGRETEFKPNVTLIYVYDDGTTKKVLKIE